jgi:hypothetical protein
MIEIDGHPARYRNFRENGTSLQNGLTVPRSFVILNLVDQNFSMHPFNPK